MRGFALAFRAIAASRAEAECASVAAMGPGGAGGAGVGGGDGSGDGSGIGSIGGSGAIAANGGLSTASTCNGGGLSTMAMKNRFSALAVVILRGLWGISASFTPPTANEPPYRRNRSATRPWLASIPA